MSAKIENSTADLLNAMRSHVNALADEKVIDPVRIRYAIGDRKILAAQFHAQGLSNREAAEVLGVDERTVRRDLGSANAEAGMGDEIETEDIGSANAAETPPASHWSTILSAANAAGREVPWDVEAVAKMLDSTDRFIKRNGLRDRPMTREEAEEFTSRLGSSLSLIRRPDSYWRKHTPGMLEWLEQQFDLLFGELAPEPAS